VLGSPYLGYNVETDGSHRQACVMEYRRFKSRFPLALKCLSLS
jgi:hypothetical protein